MTFQVVKCLVQSRSSNIGSHHYSFSNHLHTLPLKSALAASSEIPGHSERKCWQRGNCTFFPLTSSGPGTDSKESFYLKVNKPGTPRQSLWNSERKNIRIYYWTYPGIAHPVFSTLCRYHVFWRQLMQLLTATQGPSLGVRHIDMQKKVIKPWKTWFAREKMKKAD